MSDVGLTHVALPVRSLAASIAFYARFADMQVVHQRPQVVWLSDRTRPFVIVLWEETEEQIRPLAHPAHLGVGLASRQLVNERCALAREQGCLIVGPTDSGPPVGYWASLRDPDGHCLELSHGQDVGLAVGDAP